MTSANNTLSAPARRLVHLAWLAGIALPFLLATPAAAQVDSIECPAGQERNGALCYPKCEAGYTASGLFCTKPCPAGFTNDGLTCRKDAHIVAKESYGRGAGSPMQCSSDQEQNGALCYPKCKAGFYGVGPVCWQSCPAGYSDHGATCYRSFFDWFWKSSYGRTAGTPLNSCPAGTERNGALCYPVCRAGFKGDGPVCWQASCPTGYTDDGATCRRDVQIIAKETYGRGAGTVPASIGGTCRITYPTTFLDGTPRRLNQITFLTAHNAFANSDDGWVHAQQTFKIKTQLQGGVRALMLDIYEYADEIVLCHGKCDGALGSHYVLPRVRLRDALKPVKEFLDANPREIVTIILESYVGKASKVKSELESAGLANQIYDPEDDPEWRVEQKQSWPSLPWLIARNRRLVVTSSRFADSESGSIGPVPHFKVAVENTYDLGAFGNDVECTARGESQPLDDKGKLFVFNHFRSLPNLVAAGEDNGESHIVDRIRNRCMPNAKRPPSFVAVDFYQHPYCGPAKAVMEMNALWEEHRSLFGFEPQKEFTLFDSEFYRTLHPDIASLYGPDKAEDTPDYWKRTGKHLGQSASTQFDLVFYLNQYEDLRKAFGDTNYEKAVEHWITYGIQEGRRGSLFFDVQYYLHANPDLKQAFGGNYLAAMRHWIEHGLKEGRRASADFDVSHYYRAYPDLQQAFGNDHRRLMIHYLQYGRNEGRQAIP